MIVVCSVAFKGLPFLLPSSAVAAPVTRFVNRLEHHDGIGTVLEHHKRSPLLLRGSPRPYATEEYHHVLYNSASHELCRYWSSTRMATVVFVKLEFDDVWHMCFDDTTAPVA